MNEGGAGATLVAALARLIEVRTKEGAHKGRPCVFLTNEGEAKKRSLYFGDNASCQGSARGGRCGEVYHGLSALN